MKSLILMRHAKSGWDDDVLRDFDRPLNTKGERAAATMGRHARKLGIGFDRVVASPALRVEQTLHHFGRGYGAMATVSRDRRIYLGSGATLFEILREFEDTDDRVLVAGHDPGLADLILAMVPDRDPDALRAAVREKFPTASIAVLEFDLDDWREVAADSARLRLFVRPRDVDPEFGPDA